jgi:hypothetical protein
MPISNVQKLTLGIEKVRNLLPKGVDLVDIGGQTVFPVFGPTGGLCYAVVSYVVKRGDGPWPNDDEIPMGNAVDKGNNWKFYGVKYNLDGDVETFANNLLKAAKEIA